MVVKYTKSEMKCIIKSKINKKWQERWDKGSKGRHLYSIQRKVGEMRESHRSRKEEDIISRMRLGHTGQNSTLYAMRKHATGNCEYCGLQETVEHVFLHCPRYRQQRQTLKTALQRNQLTLNMTELLRRDSGDVEYRAIFRFLQSTGVIIRI